MDQENRRKKERINMMSVQEKERLANLQKYMEHQQMAAYYEEQLYRRPRNRKSVDVSNRLRDAQGRFMKNELSNMQDMESLYDWDEDEWEPRDIRIKKVENTYGTYDVEERFLGEKLLCTILMLAGIVMLPFIF
jgi:hypothetical protein